MAYMHCEFSPTGDKLVSVGGEPDFTITVWDWMEQRVTLKSKAFSAEVFRCSFSPYADNILFTSGSGRWLTPSLALSSREKLENSVS
jgi:WD40 repeat protein